MRPIAIRLDPDTRRRLKLLSDVTGYSREALVDEAVRRFVDAELAALIEQQRLSASQTEEAEASQPPERRHFIV